MRARPESGFLLIGVIMFVLALTILGMSLYSLSSYEAEFQMDSRDSNEALYRAQGGIQMVLHLLELNWKFADAQLAVGHSGVDSVYVSQNQPGGGLHTTGNLYPDSITTVTVIASEHNKSRKLVARFRPMNTASYYARLFTVGSGGVAVLYNNNLSPLPGTTPTFVVSSSESLWTNDANMTAANAWANRLVWPGPKLLRFPGAPPTPDVPGFIAAHLPGASPPGYNSGTQTVTFNAGAGTTFYGGVPSSPSNPDWTFYVLTGLTLNVRGTAIWMLPAGLVCWQNVTVNAIGGTATLVLVGSPKLPARGSDPEKGLFFFGGLDVDPNVNVILVSNGQVDIEQAAAYDKSYDVDHLSVFCNSLLLRGPGYASGVLHKSTLTYDATMTPVIRALEMAGSLPSTSGAPPSSFAFVKGSWRDLTP